MGSSHPSRYVECDDLGGEYVYNFRLDKFFLVRWNPNILPVIFTLHESAVDYQIYIEEVVEEINTAAYEEGLLFLLGKEGLVQLSDESTTQDMKDPNTHTIRFSILKDYSQVGTAYWESQPDTGEIFDADFEMYIDTFHHIAKQKSKLSGLQAQEYVEKRLKHYLIHEFLHAMGIGHNFRGSQYDSMMAYYPRNSPDPHQVKLSHKLSNYDRKTLLYQSSPPGTENPGDYGEFDVQRYQ